MTHPDWTRPDPLPPAVTLEITNPLDGCTECASQHTDQFCACHGRRCAAHRAHPAITEREAS